MAEGVDTAVASAISRVRTVRLVDSMILSVAIPAGFRVCYESFQTDSGQLYKGSTPLLAPLYGYFLEPAL